MGGILNLLASIGTGFRIFCYPFPPLYTPFVIKRGERVRVVEYLIFRDCVLSKKAIHGERAQSGYSKADLAEGKVF